MNKRKKKKDRKNDFMNIKYRTKNTKAGKKE